MKLKIFEVSITLYLILVSTLLFADDYTRSYEFDPIHIERDILIKAASEIYAYVITINGNSGETEGYIRLGRDDFVTELKFPISEKDYEKFPKISHSAYVEISDHHGIVYSIKLSLNDVTRDLEVRGRSYDHVTGLIKVVQEKLYPYNVMTGGIKFRLILMGILVLFYLIALSPIFCFFKSRDQVIVYILSLVLMNVLIHLPPWSKIFPGFLAGVENRSFLENNAALFTFLGFAITLLVPFIPLSIKYYKKKVSL